MPSRYVRNIYDAHLPYNAHITYDGLISVPLCDQYGRILEFDQYVSPDGLVYDLHAPEVRAVISRSGEGMSPINYITSRGYRQPGETVKSFFLQPRTVQLVIRANSNSRQAWYKLKNDIVTALRPNRTVVPKTGVLRHFMPNGQVIGLDVLLIDGLRFEPRPDSAWDEWAINETLRFQALDPTYYDTVAQTREFSGVLPQLVFPAKFPIVFGGLDVTLAVIYGGNWPAFPSITVLGPIVSPAIQNIDTGEKVALSYSLATGHSLTFNMAYNFKSVDLDDGTNLNGYLTSDSNIANFHLAPNPEVNGGLNRIRVTGTGVTGATNITLSWNNRYVAAYMKAA